MKIVVVIAAVLAVASAQFSPFPSPAPIPFQPSRLPPSPSPLPFATSPRPSVVPVVNRVATGDRDAIIGRYDNDVGPDGSFAYAYDTSNGISAEAQGVPRNFGGNPPLIPVVISGRFGYISPEGQQVSITYIADENGYQPQGDAIPTPPPIPEPILRSLEYLARNAYPAAAGPQKKLAQK